jgi:hypothetical protein
MKYSSTPRLALYIIAILGLLLGEKKSCALHLKGTFNTDGFFLFLTRFGIQPTDLHNEHDTKGYIYGNITILNAHNINNTEKLDENQLIMLTVMDKNYFIDYYNKRRILPRFVACPMMFAGIEKTAYFYECNENGHQDFVRRVPCPRGKTCLDEDNQKNLIPGSQFTYKIQDSNQARFWYISLVACTRDKCVWRDLNTVGNQTVDRPISYTIAYDIWIVNGNPNAKSNNRFEHEFSYELHDIFEIYLCSFLIYLFVLPLIAYRCYLHFHYMYVQVFVYVGVEVGSRLLALTHNLAFSFDGRGVIAFQFLADFLEVTASSVLILILLSMAKGWTIRSKQLILSRRFVAFGIFLQLTLVTSHMIALVVKFFTELTLKNFIRNNIIIELKGNYRSSFQQKPIRNSGRLRRAWYSIRLHDVVCQRVKRDIQPPGISCNKKHSFFELFLNEEISTKILRNNLIFYFLGTENVSSLEKTENDMDETDSDDDEYVVVNKGKQYARLNSDQNRIKPAQNFTANFSRDERLRSYQKFYLHFGACCLVWFIYLPVLIFVTSFVSELFRLRLVLSELNCIKTMNKANN